MGSTPLGALLACVLVAGCSGLVGPVQTPVDRSPTPTPTAHPATAPPPSVPENGIAADGVSNPLRLSRAHAEALADRSHTYWMELTVRTAEGDLVLRRRVEATVGPDGERFALLANETAAGDAAWWVDALFGDRYPFRAFADGTTVVVHPAEDREASRYADVERSPVAASHLDGHNSIYRTFYGVDTTVTATRQRDGVVVLRVAATDAPQHYGHPILSSVNVSVGELNASIERGGLVRHVERSATYTLGNATVRVSRTLSVTDLGDTTVRRPDWVDDTTDRRLGWVDDAPIPAAERRAVAVEEAPTPADDAGSGGQVQSTRERRSQVRSPPRRRRL